MRRYGDPAAVPEAGVPDNAPAINVTPLGSTPLVSAMPGIGVPLAVTEKLPAANTVNEVALALVKAGGTGVAVGVTITEADTLLVKPAALVAVTEQMYCVPLVKLVTVIGETELLPAPLGVQAAL